MNNIILPRYPSTSVADGLLSIHKWHIEEKVDGANCGILYQDKMFYVRNRDHFLSRSHVAKTAAKKQFVPLWEFLYSNKNKFNELNKQFGRPLILYAEWLWYVHGVRYTSLHSPLLIFSLFDPEYKKFLDPIVTKRLIESSELPSVPYLSEIEGGYLDIVSMCRGPSQLGGQREGIVLKTGDGRFQTGVFKIIDPEYNQNSGWSNDNPIRQFLV